MKKKLWIISILTVGILGMYSCENDAGADCELCNTQKIFSTGEVELGIEEEYCLDELDEIKANPEEVSPEGDIRTIWICR